MTALPAQRTPLRPILGLAARPAPPRLQQAADGVVASDALLQGQREILITHGEAVYRLRHTSNGKLILTK